jgi:hypothetical protein
MQPLTLSAFILCHNQAHLLPRQIAGLSAQDYRPFETILIDDASTDGTYDLMIAFHQTHSQARVIRNERNLGAIGTCNVALQASSGDFVYGGASDDAIRPGLFEALMAAASLHPDCGMVFCDPIWEMDGRTIPQHFGLSDEPRYFSPDEAADLFRSRRLRLIPGHTMAWNRRHLAAVGCFRPAFGSLCDIFPMVALALRHGFCYVPRPLALATFSATQFSRINANQSRNSRAAHQAMLSAFASDEFLDIRDRLIRSRILMLSPHYFMPIMRTGRPLAWASIGDIASLGIKAVLRDALYATGLQDAVRRLRGGPALWRAAKAAHRNS